MKVALNIIMIICVSLASIPHALPAVELSDVDRLSVVLGMASGEEHMRLNFLTLPGCSDEASRRIKAVGGNVIWVASDLDWLVADVPLASIKNLLQWSQWTSVSAEPAYNNYVQGTA